MKTMELLLRLLLCCPSVSDVPPEVRSTGGAEERKVRRGSETAAVIEEKAVTQSGPPACGCWAAPSDGEGGFLAVQG